MTDNIDTELRTLAACAYGEASTDNHSEEIGAIAFAIANRAKAWGKTLTDMMDYSGYIYAKQNANARYEKLMKATKTEIEADTNGMAIALSWAKKAKDNTGTDPSGGAFFWDGLDFSTNINHPKRVQGFKYSNTAHNIFSVPENVISTVTIYWQAKNKDGQLINTKVRGTYDHVWVSTAVQNSTSIFWKYNPDYIKATGAKSYV